MSVVGEGFPVSDRVAQAKREWASSNASQYVAVIGVCPTAAVIPETIPHLHRPVRDEDTPSHEDIDAWVTFGTGHAKHGPLLVYCEAGRNRSSIVAALIAARLQGEMFYEVVATLHDRFLEAGHNWWPYEHWQEAIDQWWKKDFDYRDGLRRYEEFKSENPVHPWFGSRPD